MLGVTPAQRFRLPRNGKALPQSRIRFGPTWPALVSTIRVKFDVYRYETYSAKTRVDMYFGDLDDYRSMALDVPVLIEIKVDPAWRFRPSSHEAFFGKRAMDVSAPNSARPRRLRCARSETCTYCRSAWDCRSLRRRGAMRHRARNIRIHYR